jgi:branched-chain amino acid transport system substrate-binding protein
MLISSNILKKVGFASACGLLWMLILSAVPAAADNAIKIGAAFGLQGTWSAWCKANVIAMEMAIEEINAGGGINGIPLTAVIYDTASKPEEAARLVNRLTNDDQVLAILGPFSSSECEVAFPVGKRLGIVMISQASSKPGVAKPGRPYAFRNKADEIALAVPAISAWKKAYNVRSVVIVHDAKDAVGRALGTAVLPAVSEKLGLQIVNKDGFVTFSTGDFDMKPQVTKLKTLNFDGIVFGGLYKDGVTFIKEARRQELNQPMVAGNPLMSHFFPKQGGKAADGTYTSSEFYHWMADERVKRFTAEFSKRAVAKGMDPHEPLQFDVNIYDSINMLAHVMKEKRITNKPENLVKEREMVQEGLNGLKGFPGLAGPVEFTPDGDVLKKIYVVKALDGRWVLAE